MRIVVPVAARLASRAKHWFVHRNHTQRPHVKRRVHKLPLGRGGARAALRPPAASVRRGYWKVFALWYGLCKYSWYTARGWT